mmetsp:Transcript_10137/g.15009  ORF Transcript_10137/g.15009 Transcript_10137/m.15009 type:complete len:455 (-) Transcript_10137:858-2222(-)
MSSPISPLAVTTFGGRLVTAAVSDGTVKIRHNQQINPNQNPIDQLKDRETTYLAGGVVLVEPTVATDQERQTIRDTAIKEGLRVLRIMNSSIAAAISYGMDDLLEETTIIVAECGLENDSTTTFVVLSLDEGIFDVAATASCFEYTDEEASTALQKALQKAGKSTEDIYAAMVCGYKPYSSNAATLLKSQFGTERFRSSIDSSVVAAYGAAVTASRLGDIGHFVAAKDAGDSGIFLCAGGVGEGSALKAVGHTTSQETINNLIEAVGADSDAHFEVAAKQDLISAAARAALMQRLDVLAATEQQRMTDNDSTACGGVHDVQEVLTDDHLTDLIGEESMASLRRAFVARDGRQHNMVKLRRVEAMPACQSYCSNNSSGLIGWHTDFARRTLQVALNSDDEYEGGRLMYATMNGLHIPQRQAGCATLHESSIAHGVSEMTAGCRYGLFLLDTGYMT